MRDVLQPLNEKAAEIVVKHADMLQSDRMEPLLLQLVAHVSAYRVILARRARRSQSSCEARAHPAVNQMGGKAVAFRRTRLATGAARCAGGASAAPGILPPVAGASQAA